MQSSSAVFRRSLGDWAIKAGDQLDALARVSISLTCEDTVDYTPIDTAFLVGNWQPSLNAIPKGTVDEKGDAAARVRITLKVAQVKAGDVFYLINNAVYAKRIEFGFVGPDSLGRVYNQAGRHMVTRAIARWHLNVEKAAAKVLPK